MSEDSPGVHDSVEISAMAINVTVPDALCWKDSRRGVEFILTTLTVRMLPNGRLAAKAYGRPVDGGRGGYTSFRVPDSPELNRLIEDAAALAGTRWTQHSGLDTRPTDRPA